MKRQALTAASCAFLALAPGMALADCAEELAALEAGAEEAGDGLVNEGVVEPAEPATDEAQGVEPPTDAAAAAATNAGQGATAGATDATANAGAGAGADAAAMGQDAQAEQPAEGEGAERDPGRDEAIERARAELAAGDEGGCMSALEEARMLGG